MNFDDALSAHVAWKSKLSAYVRRPDKSLNATTVATDNGCPLGQWIHGEGKKHASLAEYRTLLAQHAAFHKAAADVIRRADAGEKVNDEIAIGKSSPFATASSAVVSAINELRRKL